MNWKYDPVVEIRHGRWQDVLAGESVDSMITDSPYSARTHEGRRTGSEIKKSGIEYAPLEEKDCTEFVESWDGRVREWWVHFGDDETAYWWKRALAKAGKYTFPFVPFVKTDAAPRMTGDGPASATEYIVVARERHMPDVMFSRPPYYMGPTSSTRGTGGAKGFPGEKPLWLMQALVRDYSQRGGLVADPFSGRGTTAYACAVEGRGCIASEVNKITWNASQRRMKGGVTTVLPGIAAMDGKQIEMEDS